MGHRAWFVPDNMEDMIEIEEDLLDSESICNYGGFF